MKRDYIITIVAPEPSAFSQCTINHLTQAEHSNNLTSRKRRPVVTPHYGQTHPPHPSPAKRCSCYTRPRIHHPQVIWPLTVSWLKSDPLLMELIALLFFFTKIKLYCIYSSCYSISGQKLRNMWLFFPSATTCEEMILIPEQKLRQKHHRSHLSICLVAHLMRH